MFFIVRKGPQLLFYHEEDCWVLPLVYGAPLQGIIWGMVSILRHPLLRGIVTGTLILICGLSSVWLFQFARTGEAWEQWRADRLSLSSFYFERGNYYFGGTEYDIEKALANFEQARSFTNVYEDPITYQIGRIYFIKGDLTRAIAEFDAQLVEKPDYPKTYYMRGLSYGYRNQFKQAEEDFLKYLEKY